MHSSGQMPVWKQILFTGLALCLVWAGLELIVLFYAFVRNDSPKTELMYTAHPYRSFALRPNYVSPRKECSVNSFGVRGPEISEKSTDTIRIVCLGGSTTFSPLTTTDTHTYPAYMQGVLRDHYGTGPFDIEVVNAGVSAATSIESLIFFQTHLLNLSPDIAIFHQALNDAYISTKYPGFQSDYSHERMPLTREKPALWEWSPALSFLYARGKIGNPYFPGYKGDLLPLIYMHRELLRNPKLKRKGPVEPEMIAAFERNVMSFIAIARGNGVEPVLSTEVFFDDRPVSDTVFEAVMVYNERLREIGRREHVDLIDFDREMDWDEWHFGDMCHLLDVPGGLDRKGGIFARSLIDCGTVERVWQKRAGDADQAPPRE